MNYTDNFELSGNVKSANTFLDSISSGNFFFSFVISYSETCEIPGITIAGSNKDMIKFTPPADAEYLHYGYCKSIDGIPITPDGKPTPGILTKTALESASIPHITINAGSKISPQLPFIDTGLEFGKNISSENAMTDSQVASAVDYGRIVGRTLASMTDCLIIGESIPGGTTTSLAVMKGFGIDAKVSSSMPENPVKLKQQITDSAIDRITSDHPYSIVASVGDPMIAFVAGMLSSASVISKVLLAGGTQMGGVLAFASKIGFNEENTAKVIPGISQVSEYEMTNENKKFPEIIESRKTLADLTFPDNSKLSV